MKVHKTDLGHVVLGDEIIKEGNWYAFQNRIYQLKPGDTLGPNCFKLIATIGFKLDGVPYAELPDNDDEIIKKGIKHWQKIIPRGIKSKQTEETWEFAISNIVDDVWKKAREKYKYTERDVIELINFLSWRSDFPNIYLKPHKEFLEEFLESRNKRKEIQEVEFETMIMNMGYNKPEDYPYQECEILKITPDPEHKAGKLTIKSIK
jgi:hypothetical protein